MSYIAIIIYGLLIMFFHKKLPEKQALKSIGGITMVFGVVGLWFSDPQSTDFIADTKKLELVLHISILAITLFISYFTIPTPKKK